MFQITLTTPAEIVEALPILIGYVPEERFLVSLQKGSRVVVTASYDLAVFDDVAAQVEGLADLVTEAEADHALAVVYSTDPLEYASGVADLLAVAGVPAVMLGATADQWMRFDEDALLVACGPRERHNDAVLGAVVSGLQLPRLTRDQLARRYQPCSDHVDDLRHEGSQAWNGESWQTLAAPLLDCGGMDGHAVRSLAAALMVEEVWTAIFSGFGVKDARRYLPILAAASTYYDDTPATLREEREAERILVVTGLCAWLAGDGAALAVICGRLADRTKAGCIAFEEVALERAIVIAACALGKMPTQWLAGRDES